MKMGQAIISLSNNNVKIDSIKGQPKAGLFLLHKFNYFKITDYICYKSSTMRNYFIFSLFIISSTVFGQEYWQQRVNYKIDVKLNDKNHTMSAFEEFEYINNSPNSLSKIYVHLWPNAYKDGNSALAKQQYNDGDSDLKYGPDEIKGFIDSLDFKVNGQKATWYFDALNQDICVIELKEPINTGQSIVVTTPFFVKIPSGSISRLGHIGESYQITQWYPKPAVYDQEGWHQMPYLNQGEFYSEYGSFDVSITLPENYVVGATGDLQTKTEIEFLERKADETLKNLQGADYSKALTAKTPNPVIESSSDLKTIRYTQDNVHDFAWFADKRYKVLKGEVSLPHSGRKVTSWAMFTPKNESLWKDAIEYLNDAVHYYSLWNGDYPYNQVTAVDGTISAGGGMEYPNVTVIGNSANAKQLEVVIVHEVGHNWFYGQLGSNERVHGWMDEGMNTLNEVRYMQTKYPENTEMSDMVLGGRFHFNDLDHHDMSDISYRTIAAIGEDQAIETHSARFTSANYGVVMYQKTGLVFFYLKDYLGEELFDACMQDYYDAWEFRHPQPDDMRKSLEKSSGKDLSWLFDDLIKTTKHVDYKIKRVKKTNDGFTVTTKNVGQIDGPIEINSIKDSLIVNSTWIEPGKKKNTIEINGKNLESIVIDKGRDIPEINRQNNVWTKKGLFDKLEPLKIEYLIGDNEENRTNVFWTPMIASNIYDKFMLGATFHNVSIAPSKFTYLIAPFYSFGRSSVSGVSEMSYSMLPATTFKTSRIGLSVKSFKQDTTARKNDGYYISVAPYWTAKIGNRGDAKPFSNTIRVQSIYKKDVNSGSHSEYAGAYIDYSFDFKKPDHKVHVNLRNEYMTNTNTSDEVARIFASGTYAYRYLKNKQKRWIEIRAFVGQQYIRNYNSSINGYKYGMSLAGTDGKQDLFIDEYYFGRNELTGIWSQQRDENMGGFKTTSNYGTTGTGMATANLYFQLPILPSIIGLYADAGVFDNGKKLESALNTGIGIRMKNVFGIYFPIWMSKELNDSFGNSKYVEKIRFTLKFNIANKTLNLNTLM